MAVRVDGLLEWCYEVKKPSMIGKGHSKNAFLQRPSQNQADTGAQESR